MLRICATASQTAKITCRTAPIIAELSVSWPGIQHAQKIRFFVLLFSYRQIDHINWHAPKTTADRQKSDEGNVNFL
tara:strand:+ start:79907 stop:80134 length:228 start_codon:yes stop_codon:yes gene_type:complete